MKLYRFRAKNIPYILGLVFNSFIALLVSYCLSFLIDKIIVAHKFSLLPEWFWGTIILVLFGEIWNMFIGQYLPIKVDLMMSIRISRDGLMNLIHMSQKNYSEKDKGYYYNVITNSAFTYGSMYEQFYIQFIANALVVLIILSLVFYINPFMGLLFLLYVPIVAVSTKKPGDVIAKYQEKGMPTQDDFLAETRNIIESKREINIARADKYYYDRYYKSSGKYLDFITRFRFFENMATNLPLLINRVYNVIVLGAASYLCFQGKLTIGTILLLYQFLSYYSSPVSEVFRILTRNNVNKPNYERIEDLDKRSGESAGFGKLRVSDNFAEFHNFNLYRDSNEQNLLFHINDMTIPKNSFIIIKGENGSGKSMLINYITGYLDEHFGTGNCKIAADINKAAYLTYPALIVNGSFQDNMLGIQADENIRKMLRIDFDNKEISSNPINLSYGQQQKLNLLRVLSSEASYLFLDEPMSNLDVETQKSLCNYLISLKKKKTIVLIMHDNSLDSFADKIIRINNSKEVLAG